MTVQAQWFVDLGVVDDDPFGANVKQVGRPIDLLGDEPKLNQRLIGLMQQEESLERAGVSCPIKAQRESVCSACPIRQTDALDPKSALCNVGLTMERTLTSMAILRADRAAKS